MAAGKKKTEQKKKGKNQLVARVVLGMNLGSVALLWFCCAGQWISPARFSLLALGGLAFPFALVLAGFSLLLCLVLTPRRVWLPAVGILVCGGSLRTYYPVNFPSPVPRGCVGVMTYNVCGFSADGERGAGVARHIAASGADIVAMQEAYLNPVAWEEAVWPVLKEKLPYCDTLHAGENVLMVVSAYPVVGKEMLFRHKTNAAGVFQLKMSERDTLWLVNAHLESMHLSGDELSAYSTMVHGVRDGGDFGINEQSALDIVRKIQAAGRLRAEQADSLVAFLERNKERNVMVCGDFNDSPVSYAHHSVERYLEDAHTQAGQGVDRSYNRNAIFVRIDQMFYSPDRWKPYGCRVESRPELSDHNPMICFFRRRNSR